MKKLTFLMMAAMVMGLAMLTSCEKKDDTGLTNTSKKDTAPAFVQMRVVFNATQDMLDYCNIVMKYNDGTGEQSETVTSLEWSKTLKTSLPATLTFSREVTLKSDRDASAVEKINFTNFYSYRYDLLNKQGEELGKIGTKANGSASVASGSNFVSFVNQGKMDKTLSYSFDENGTMIQ